MFQPSVLTIPTVHRVFVSKSDPRQIILRTLGKETKMSSIILPFALLLSVGGIVQGTENHPMTRLTYHLRHPQEQFCSADFAVHAQIFPTIYTEEGKKHKIHVYDLKILEIYKGENLLKNQTNSVQGNISDLTGLVVKAYADRVQLKSGLQSGYLLTGLIKNNKLKLNLGSWIEEWTVVTPAYRAGISGIYAQNCECHITPCFGNPCKPVKGCDVSPRQLRAFYQSCKWRHSYCGKNGEGNACFWHETAEYMNCTSQIP